MAAAFRIKRLGTGAVAVAAGPSESFQYYLDRLMKMIPGEAVSLYLVGSGIIPERQPLLLVGWALLCLLGVFAIRVYGTADAPNNRPPDWIHVGISSVAFVIWVYTLGGPFTAFGLHVPYLGSLLVLAWTFFIPIFYRGPKD